MSPGAQAGRLRRAVGGHVREHDAAVEHQPQPRRERRRDRLRAHADHSAAHAPALAQLLVDRAHDAARGREADALVAAGLRQDHRVEPDHAALGVDERPAAVARVHRRVGLHVDHRVVGLELARDRAHHPEAGRVLEPERAAEGQHQLALVQQLGVPELERRQAGAVDLEHRDVGLAVDAHHARAQPLAARPQDRAAGRGLVGLQHVHLDAARVLDHVGVRDDPALRVDDHARARALVAREQQARRRRVARGRDLHHRRRDAPRQRLELRVERREPREARRRRGHCRLRPRLCVSGVTAPRRRAPRRRATG